MFWSFAYSESYQEPWFVKAVGDCGGPCIFSWKGQQSAAARRLCLLEPSLPHAFLSVVAQHTYAALKMARQKKVLTHISKKDYRSLQAVIARETRNSVRQTLLNAPRLPHVHLTSALFSLPAVSQQCVPSECSGIEDSDSSSTDDSQSSSTSTSSSCSSHISCRRNIFGLMAFGLMTECDGRSVAFRLLHLSVSPGRALSSRIHIFALHFTHLIHYDLVRWISIFNGAHAA